MPVIYLDADTSHNPYGHQYARIHEQYYGLSRLFKFFEHKPLESAEVKADNIKIYKKYSGSGYGDHVTLRATGNYSKQPLKSENVFFNQYDPKRTRLLLILFFKNDPIKLQNKYYTSSNFNRDIRLQRAIFLTNMDNYINEMSVLNVLIEENDKIDDLLTFRIDIKTNSDDNLYNNGRIRVVDDSQSMGNINKSGFKKYKHDPETKYKNLISCFLYNTNVPMEKSKLPISEIQGKKYNVTVYWSNKVPEPLLLEFNSVGFSNTSNKYYYHTRDDDGSLYWKEIKQGDKVLNVQLTSGKDVYSQLADFSNKKLSDLLKAIESHLQKTIVFMIDKKQDQYEQSTFKSSFTDSRKYRLINKQIKVTDKTSLTEGQCLEKYGFKLFVHDFATSVSEITKEKAHLRFIVPSNKSNNYSEITLYNNETTLQEDVEVLEYKSSDKKLYAHFYGDDTRPLLICYLGSAYKPKDVSEYNSKWVYVTSITSSVCTGKEATTGPNKAIINELTQIICLLNPVQLNPKHISSEASTKITKDEEGSATYELHKYRHNISIQMKITSKNMNCYRKYTYEPNGTDGNKEGFRLGSVVHTNSTASDITYKLNYTETSDKKFYPLTSVSSYYHTYDDTHNYPLLVILSFNTNKDNEYYKLTNKGKPYEWTKINKEVDLAQIEKCLYQIRTDLQINFTNEDYNKSLFKPKNCTEDDPDLGALIGGPAGGLACAGALGGSGYLVYIKVFATTAPV